MSMSYRHSKKLQDFAGGFNIRLACLYASSKAPRCPFHMIFQVQLLVCSVQRRPLHIWMLHKHIIKTHKQPISDLRSQTVFVQILVKNQVGIVDIANVYLHWSE